MDTHKLLRLEWRANTADYIRSNARSATCSPWLDTWMAGHVDTHGILI